MIDQILLVATIALVAFAVVYALGFDADGFDQSFLEVMREGLLQAIVLFVACLIVSGLFVAFFELLG